MSRAAVLLPVSVFVSRDVEAGGMQWEKVCLGTRPFVWVTKETGRPSGRYGYRRLSRHFAIYTCRRTSRGTLERSLVTRRASAESAIAFANDVAVDSEFWK